MTFFDIVALSASNLWRRKLRTALTVLGVIIGTACIVIMVALGIGNLEQFNESVMQSTNLTQIEVYNYYSGAGTGGLKLDENAIEQFKEMPGVDSATGLLNIPSYMVIGKYECSNSVYGIDPATMDFEFEEGGLFSESDAIEVVMGSNVRQWWMDPRAANNDMFYVSYGIYGDEGIEEDMGPDIDWTNEPMTYYPYWSDGSDMEATAEMPAPKQYKARISGVLAPSNDQKSYSMYISMDAAKKLVRDNRKLMDSMGVKENEYSQAYVNCVDVDAVGEVLKSIKDMGYEAYSDTEWINQMQEEQSRQQSQLIAIGLISLLVSAIGIANTMLASILERRREIGVMKVIGLSVRKINLMFLAEAAMIGLVGGLVGLGGSYIVGAVVNMGGSEISLLGMYFAEGVRLSIPWWLALGAMALATGVGIISGIYPAIRATRMSPLEAIRSGE